MQLIPLKKRILYYLALLLISLIVLFLSVALFMLLSGNGNREKIISYILIFAIPLVIHYVFGNIFLKGKKIIKLIVPFATALVSSIIIWTMCTFYLVIKTNLFDRYDIVDAIIQVFLVFAIVWEIAYQILKIITNQNNQIKS